MEHVVVRIENKPWEGDRDRLLHRFVCSCGEVGPWEMGAPGTSEPPFTVHRNHRRNHDQSGRQYRDSANHQRMVMLPQPTPDPTAGSTTPPVIQNILGEERVEPIYEPISIGPDGLEAALAAAVPTRRETKKKPSG